MIANTTATDSFYRTVNYVLSKSSQRLYANFVSGIQGDSLAIAQDMEKMAARYPSAAMKRPGYHISLSPEQQDSISLAQWLRIVEDFVHLIGAERHQVIACLHDDTTYPDSNQPRIHAHFVINRLSPTDTLNLNFPQIERAMRQLEQQYDLTPVPCSWELRHDRAAQRKQKTPETVMDTIVDTQSQPPPATMGTILQQAAQPSPDPPSNGEGESPSPPHPPAAQIMGLGLQAWSDRLEQHPELSGLTAIGEAASVTGSTLQLSAVIWQQIQAARKNNDSQRIENLIEELEAVNQRATRLEKTLEDRAQRVEQIREDLEEVEQRTERLEEAIVPTPEHEVSVPSSEVQNQATAQDPTADPWAEPESAEEQAPTVEPGSDATLVEEVELLSPPELTSEPESKPESEQDDPLVKGVTLTNERLNQLEQGVGVRHKTYEPIEIDRHASIDRQLDQIAELIQQFHQRLDRLEEVVFKGHSLTEPASQPPHERPQSEPQQHPASTVAHASESGEAIAQGLSNYLSAQAEFYSISPYDPVTTRLGVVQMQQEQGSDQTRISIQDEEYGTKFEAIRTEEQWEVLLNDLSSAEMERLTHLPQTVGEYQTQTNTRHLIQVLQQSVPEEFEVANGKISWADEQGQFNYHFEIFTDADGNRAILGREGETNVFRARMTSEGRIRSEFSAIPPERIDNLVAQQARTAKMQQQSAL
ncbi:MAG: relaxase/mobilization nuclease domain-containing protein [Oculatellaceae cyanobacterium Prado106]|jgi:hypothetical protein|nr:relaxase/mobilization nuclease domain-containing protein [Oculatellaceae cyanobacterium Prado106]